MQTNGPFSPLTKGDYYTSDPTDASGGGTGLNHYMTLEVPCSWPSSKSIQIQLESPDMNSVATSEDEPGNNNPSVRDVTYFEIFSSNVAVSSTLTSPLAGAAGSLQLSSFQPDSTDGVSFYIWYTITNPVPCGVYPIRVSTGNLSLTSHDSLDDQNSYRIRAGHDNGTCIDGETLQLGLRAIAYQRGASSIQCLTLYTYVSYVSSVRFHNFDLDSSLQSKVCD